MRSSRIYSPHHHSASFTQKYEHFLIEWRIRIILVCILLLLVFLNIGSTTIFPQFFPLFLLVVLILLLIFYSYQNIKSNLLKEHPQYSEYFRFFESIFASLNLNPSKEKILNESFSNKKAFPVYGRDWRNPNSFAFEVSHKTPMYPELTNRTMPRREFSPNSPFKNPELNELNTLRSNEKRRHASTEPLEIKKNRDFIGFQRGRDQMNNATSIAKNVKEILPPTSNEQNFNPNVRNRMNFTGNQYSLNPQNASSKPVSISKQPRKQMIPQGNTTLFELNQRYFVEAEACFKKLGIEGNMTAWMGNCQRWIFKSVLYQFLQENMENIHDLNNELTSYFGKYLYEIQLFESPEANNFRNSRFTRVTLDDLMINYEMIKKNQSVLNPLTSNFKEIQKINEKMRNLLTTRERLERTIKIPEFENFQIRNYVFERLLVFHKQEIEGIQFVDGMKNMKQPSDNQILANFFLNYVNIESYKNLSPSNQFYFTAQIVQANYSENRKSHEVHFQQINPSYFEPHYQIISGDQGKNNVFCCIVLFFLHVKLKMAGIFGTDHVKTQRALNCIFNS